MQGNQVILSQEKQVVSLGRKSRSTLWLIQIITVYLCVTACVLSVSKGFSIPLQGSSFFFLILLPIVCSGIFLYRKKTLRYFLILLFLWIVWIGLNYAIISHMLNIISAHFLESINYYYQTRYDVYGPIFKNAEYYKALSFFMVNFIGVLSVYFSVMVVRAKSILATAIALIPFAFISLNLCDDPYAIPLLLLFLGFLGVLIIKNQTQEKSHGDCFEQKKDKRKGARHIVDTRAEKISGKTALNAMISICLVVLITVTTVMMVLPQREYKPFDYQTIDELNLIFSKIKEKITIKGWGGQYRQGGISYGKISDTDGIEYANTIQFKLQSEKEVPIYLKGYVGTIYQDGNWLNPAEGELAEVYNRYAEVLSPTDFYFLDQDFSFAANRISTNLKQEKMPYQNEITIEMVGQNVRTALIPYFPSITQAGYSFHMMQMDDAIIVDPLTASNSPYTVHYNAYPQELVQQFQQKSKLYQEEYFSEEANIKAQLYTEFATWAYTQIPEGNLSEVIDGIADYERYYYPQGATQAEKIELVQRYVAARADYSLKPGRVPKGMDFVENFLYLSKKGYCTHFATASTLLLRSLGVPTRYVEGYLVTEQDYQEMHRKGNEEMYIKDTNAHAWIEVYFPYVGWVPYEVTPGYSQLVSGGESVIESTPQEVSSENDEEEIDEVVSDVSSEMQSEESTVSDSSEERLEQSSDITSGEAVEAVDEVAVSSGATAGDKSSIGVLWLVLVLLCAIMGYFVYIRWKVNKRKRDFSQVNLNNAVIALFQYATSLLELAGYRVGQHENLEAYAKAVEKVAVVETNAMQEAVALVQKARFSPHMITQEEHKQMNTFVAHLRNTIFANMNFPKRIWYRNIRGN